MSLIDIIIWGLVIVALVYIVRRLIKRSKAGGGCAGCSGCNHLSESERMKRQSHCNSEKF